MNSKQATGGPDAAGIKNFDSIGLTLGHRRLALLDLSELGNQPMESHSERYWISYNGEVYNFPELRAELERLGQSFKSTSDTETILAGFEVWGTALFSRLSGMFAFALWDSHAHKLYLVRDTLGIKPLYWGSWNGGIAFASSVKALATCPPLAAVRSNWPVFLLAYGHLPEPITTLAAVSPVPPGQFLCFHQAQEAPTSVAFAAPAASGKFITNRQEAISEIRAVLHSAVKRHLICDAPIGVFLSGGIDSGVLARLAHQYTNQLQTTSIYFDEQAYNEGPYQELFRQQLTGANHQQDIITPDLFFDSLAQVLADEDQPTCDGINTWFISKMARRCGLKAVLSGIGGDELFGGYPSFRRMNTLNQLRRLPASLLGKSDRIAQKKFKRLVYLRIPGAAGAYLFLRGLFVPSEIARHLNMNESEVWRILETSPPKQAIPAGANFNQAGFIETNWYLRNQLLRDADAMSMAHGLEIRVPFLDPELIALMNRIHPAIKAGGEYPKQLLIDAFTDMLPEAVWKRSKMGFTFPFALWFSQHPKSKAFFDGALHAQVDALGAGNLHWAQLFVLQLVRHQTSVLVH